MPTPPVSPSQQKSAMVAKEIRFSVVMYGGVSLAIYMNGVAQELLHMVRSTARNSWENGVNTRFRFVDPLDPGATPANILKSTECIYRKLAYELNDPETDDVRFIVDVISGTSAGGINGMFLAKALTDDSLSFDTLQSLWINEGALENLLNDKTTLEDANLPVGGHPKSLLCSDRMYIKLLEALRTMKPRGTPDGLPLSQEIDLFATTTDINGRVIPLRLADMLVWERKYREDFHFRFSDRHNDFIAENDPFMAFVARCTSSFPFAFEPMQLSKLKELYLTEAWPAGVPVSDALLYKWRDRFFDTTEQVSTGDDLTRPFGDGGYLNNAPFSYVVDMLGRHGSSFPTDRKLIYVEPSPEHPEQEAVDERRSSANKTNVPNALSNSFDALIKLPGAQPIHDDLQRVVERNRLVRKVGELSSVITANIYQGGADRSVLSTQVPSPSAAGLNFISVDPTRVADFSYLVLRVYSTTDELSKVMGEWFRFTASSSFYYGLRCVVRAWRETEFEGVDDNRAVGDKLVQQYRAFLNTFDIEFHKRKYLFVRQQINAFYCFDDTARSKLKSGFGMVLDASPGNKDKRDFQQALIRFKKPFDDAHQIIGDAIRRIRPDNQLDPGDTAGQSLAVVLDELRGAAEAFRLENRAAALVQDALEIVPGMRPTPTGPGKSVVEFVLGILQQGDRANTDPVLADMDESYDKRARQVVADPKFKLAIDNAVVALSEVMRLAINESQTVVQQGLAEIFATLQQTPGAQAATEIVKFFDSRFELFDAAIYPLVYDTNVGTPEPISIIRVSPDDATQLFDHPGSQKLAGASLAHFGAFLDRSFRTNDILWGRLDGAERIIHSLLATAQLTTQQRAEREKGLIREAQLAIITEFLEERKAELAAVICEVAKSLKKTQPGKGAQAEAIRECVNATLEALPQQTFKEAMEGFLTPERILEYLAQVPAKREPNRRTTLESMTRAVRIVGGMLEGLGDETKTAGGFLIRVSTALWWLVEAAVPNGLTGYFFRRFFAMVFWFEIIMVVGGTIFNQAVQSVGLKLLAVTTLLWLLKDGFERFLLYGKGGRRGPRVTIMLSVLFAVLFVTLLVITPHRLTLWLTQAVSNFFAAITGG
jgi:patatin-related protein